MNAHRKFCLTIFEDYLKKRKIDEQSNFFSYEIIDRIKTSKLGPLQADYLASDFMEIINCYHDWTIKIASWAAWNELLEDYKEDEEKAWEIRHEFLEQIVFFCLYQPASFKDSFIKFCTLAFHFGNLSINEDYKDELDEDFEVFKRLQKNHPDPNNFFLSRPDAIKQLHRISKTWKQGPEIIDLVDQLDNHNYKAESKNWRNSAAHYLAPRLEFGNTRLVTRQIVFFSSLANLPDGTSLWQEDKTRKQVAYSFGGMSPLDNTLVFQANSRQRAIAQKLLILTHDLLTEIVQITVSKKLDLAQVKADFEQFTESAPIGKEFGAKNNDHPNR